MSATPEPSALSGDWVDLSGPSSPTRVVPAERIPQPLWYFPPRDEWPGRLWRAARRTAGRLRPLAASMVVHAVGVYLGVAAIGAALNGPPPVGGAAGADTPPLVGSVACDFIVQVPGGSPADAMPMPKIVDIRPVDCGSPWPLLEEWPILQAPPPTADLTAADQQAATAPLFGPSSPPPPIEHSDGPANVLGTPDWELPPNLAGRGDPAEAPGVAFMDFIGPDVGSVTFLSDASGSMISKMASLKNELDKAVTRLRPDQSLNVIFTTSGEPLALSRKGLVPATPNNKRGAYKMLEDVSTTGTSDPIFSVRLALRQKPQLLYLITDGDFPDNNVVLAEVRKGNANKAVRIDTIAFVNDKDTDTEFVTLLKTIAAENGGQFHRVTENELNQ